MNLNSLDDNKSQPSTSTNTANHQIISLRSHLSKIVETNKIDNYIPKRLTTVAKKRIDQELLKLFYIDFQSFRVVEDKGFIAFVRALNPSYELPNRQSISKTIIPGLYEKCKCTLKQMFIDQKPYVCITTDCWTSLNNDSFMAVTAHFLNNNFEMQTALLSCAVFYESHTSENLYKELLAIAESWTILNDHVVLAVSDNAANIKNAIQRTGWKFFGCYAHSLNLIVSNALKIPELKITLDKVKSIVSHFKRSTKANRKLIETQKNLGINNPKKILQDIVTRWNSTYYMVERFVELEPAIRSTIALLDEDLAILTGEEWQLLKELCKILNPFESATRAISGEHYMSASMVIVVTNGLLDICSKLIGTLEFSDLSRNVVKILQNGLQERVGKVEYSNTLAICTFLDPRFKSYPFQNYDAMERVKKTILEALTSLINDTILEKPIEQSEPQNPTPMSEPDSELSIWSSLDIKLSGKGKKNTNAHSRALMELQRYTEEDVLERYQDPLKWWRTNAYMFPNLAKLFKQKCCALGTSVPCERLFSKAGILLHERRTRMSAKKLEQLLFLNVNSIFS